MDICCKYILLDVYDRFAVAVGFAVLLCGRTGVGLPLWLVPRCCMLVWYVDVWSIDIWICRSIYEYKREQIGVAKLNARIEGLCK